MPHVGLDGVKGELDGPFSPRKVTPFMNLLKSNRLVSAVGSTGCMVVYFDDEGKIRGNIQRYYQTLSEKIFKIKKELAAWVEEWLPELECDIVYVRKTKKDRGACA